jgi:hypothetical protein
VCHVLHHTATSEDNGHIDTVPLYMDKGSHISNENLQYDTYKCLTALHTVLCNTTESISARKHRLRSTYAPYGKRTYNYSTYPSQGRAPCPKPAAYPSGQHTSSITQPYDTTNINSSSKTQPHNNHTSRARECCFLFEDIASRTGARSGYPGLCSADVSEPGNELKCPSLV